MDQTYQDFEVIYLDDASTDNSNQVFAQFAGNKCTQAIYNESNSGSPFKQWNKGIRLAKGDYVWIAESDDYADKRFLAELVDRLDNNPTVGLAYCHSSIVDEYDNTTSICKEWVGFCADKQQWEKDFINFGKDECSRNIIFANSIPNASAVLIRRSVYEEAGYVDETMKLCGDWMLWVKMLLISDIAFVAEPLNYFRTHSATVRNKTYINGIYAEESYQVVRHIMSNLSLKREVVEQACEVMIDRWLDVLFSGKGEIPRNCNYRIYKIASDVDSKLKLRLIKKTQFQLQQTQAVWEGSQSQLQQTQAAWEGSQSQLQQTQAAWEGSQSQLQQTQVAWECLQSQLQQMQAAWEHSQTIIRSMESSKFWKVRTAWFRLKSTIRLIVKMQFSKFGRLQSRIFSLFLENRNQPQERLDNIS